MNILRGFIFSIVLFICVFLGNFYNSYSHVHEPKKQNNICVFGGYVYKFTGPEIKIMKINGFSNIEVNNLFLEAHIENCNIHVSKDRIFISGIRNKGDISFLNMCVYDICDKKNPIKVNELEVKCDDYIFKNKHGVVYLTVYEKDKCNIISLDLEENKLHFKAQEFYSDSPSFVYLSSDNLYVVCNESMENGDFTTIHKFHNNGDILTYVDKISFEGKVLGEKFINEYMGSLRIFVSYSDSENRMYIFDENLKLLNCLDKFLCNMNINNVYFDGHMLYVGSVVNKGYLLGYDLNNLDEIYKLELSIYVNHILKLDENRIILVGSENRFDKYKNLYSDKVYELMKNVGLKILLLEDIKSENVRISSDYSIKGKYVYSSSFLDESQIIHLRDEKKLIIPIDIRDYNTDVDISSAMEVINNFYKNMVWNFKRVFSGIYVLDLDRNNEVSLNCKIDNCRSFDYEDINNISVCNGNIFIFTNSRVKVFDLNGMFLSLESL